MDEASKMLQEQQEELERIRKHRSTLSNKEGLRTTLNTLFMVLALVGGALFLAARPSHCGYGDNSRRYGVEGS